MLLISGYTLLKVVFNFPKRSVCLRGPTNYLQAVKSSISNLNTRTPTKTPALFKQTLEANQTTTTDTKLIFPRRPTGWISTRPIQAINNNKREAKREVVPEASQYQPTSSS